MFNCLSNKLFIFLICILVFSNGYSMTTEAALEQLAKSIVSTVKMKSEQELCVFKIFNKQTRKVDEAATRFKMGLYAALKKQSPNFNLFLGWKKPTGNEAYLSGFYNVTGEVTKIGIQIKQEKRILATIVKDFIIEKHDDRIIFEPERQQQREIQARDITEKEHSSNTIWHIAAISTLTLATASTFNEVEKYNDLADTNDKLMDQYDDASLSTADQKIIEKKFYDNKDQQKQIKENISKLYVAIALSLAWETYLIYSSVTADNFDERLSLSIAPVSNSFYNRSNNASVAFKLSYAW